MSTKPRMDQDHLMSVPKDEWSAFAAANGFADPHQIDIVDELFASDEASALTNRAAREIEHLREELGNAATDRTGLVGDPQ